MSAVVIALAVVLGVLSVLLAAYTFRKKCESKAAHTAQAKKQVPVHREVELPPPPPPPIAPPLQNTREEDEPGPDVEGELGLKLQTMKSAFNIKHSDIVFGKILGEGSQGCVCLGELRSEKVAVKTLNANATEEALSDLIKEADILRSLRHPNLTLFMGLCMKGSEIHVITEFAPRGSLWDLFSDERLKEQLTWPRTVAIARDVAQGMLYLHSNNPPVLHRDLKSQNILLSAHWKGKICDFGFAVSAASGRQMTQCGTPFWMSPEMILDTNDQTSKADVFSFGVCLWEMYTKQCPYMDTRMKKWKELEPLLDLIAKKGFRPTVPATMPAPYRTLMTACWAHRPEDRPNFTQILSILQRFLADPALMSHKPVVESRRGKRELKRDPADEYPQDHSHIVLSLESLLGDVPMRAQSVKGTPVPQNKFSDILPVANGAAGSGTLDSELTNLVEMKERPPVQVMIGSMHMKTSFYISTYKKTRVVVQKWTLGESESSKRTEMKQMLSSKIDKVVQLRHPNLCQVVGISFEDQSVLDQSVLDHSADKASASAAIVFNMVSEPALADCVSLSDMLTTSRNNMSWDRMMQIMNEVCAGMVYLHYTGPAHMAHGLLSASDVLIRDTGVKLCNYWFRDPNSYLTRVLLKPCRYTPPEFVAAYVLQHSIEKDKSSSMGISASNVNKVLKSKSQIPADGQMTTKGNVYSFGVIMWEMINGSPYLSKYHTADGKELKEEGLEEVIKGVKVPVTPYIPKPLMDLLSACLDSDCDRRPSFKVVADKLAQIKDVGPSHILLDAQHSIRYRPIETVYAFQSKDPIAVMTEYGKKKGSANCFVIDKGSGDADVMPLAQFKETYVHVPGKVQHQYRKQGYVFARQMDADFIFATEGCTLRGNKGDFLIQNSVNTVVDEVDQWTMKGGEFEAVYEVLDA